MFVLNSEFEKLLTPGGIKDMVERKNPETVVVQYLDCKNISFKNVVSTEIKYNIIIWDGIQSDVFVVVAPKLNHLIIEKKLKKNSLIRLEKYGVLELDNEIQGIKKLIVVLDLTVVVSGEEIGGVIRSSDSESGTESTFSLQSVLLQNDVFASASIIDASMAIKLTANSIREMLENRTIENPVLQFLDIQQIKFQFASGEHYRLLLSDGEDCSSNFILAPKFNDLTTNGSLTPYSVIRLESYKMAGYCETRPIPMLWILKFTVLEKGDIIKGIIESVRKSQSTEV